MATLNEEIAKLRNNLGKPYQKEVDKVLSKKTAASRARAAIDLWLKVNPIVEMGDGSKMRAKDAHRLFTKDLKVRRAGMNEFGTNKSGSMRLALSMLPEMWHFIQLFHPDLFEGSSEAQRARGRKLIKEFPEYRVPERI